MIEVNDDDLFMDEDYCYWYKSKLFTGVSRRWIDDRLITEEHFWHGMKQGRARSWDYEDGYLRKEVMYQANCIHGLLQVWYENGRRKSIELLEHGICVKRAVWDQFARLVEVYMLEEGDFPHELLMSRRAYHAARPLAWEVDPKALAELEAALSRRPR